MIMGISQVILAVFMSLLFSVMPAAQAMSTATAVEVEPVEWHAIKYEQIDGWYYPTAEAGDEVWLGMYSDDDYTSYTYVHFPLRDGMVLNNVSGGTVAATDPKTGLYIEYSLDYYEAYEIFLMDVQPDDILLDVIEGLTNGVAMYADEDRAAAMFGLSDKFTLPLSRMTIDIMQEDGRLSRDELAELIQDETERVRGLMLTTERPPDWNSSIASVELIRIDSEAGIIEIAATLDTRGLSITRFGRTSFSAYYSTEDEFSVLLEVYLTTYEDEEAEDGELPDGTKLKIADYDEFISYYLPVFSNEQETCYYNIDIYADRELADELAVKLYGILSVAVQ
ncbi:hypothetical protein AGMMS49992_19830 [Clostridia bacterium]|nr:hypothetical protein AGMMS49992_19830 [Clostridia bacterium]